MNVAISRGLKLTAGGILLGIIAGLVLRKLLGTLLYNVSPHDPAAFGSSLAVMSVISIAACLLPACRTARTDPARVLRD
jgi:putative ABC transport system permease protein